MQTTTTAAAASPSAVAATASTTKSNTKQHTKMICVIQQYTHLHTHTHVWQIFEKVCSEKIRNQYQKSIKWQTKTAREKNKATEKGTNNSEQLRTLYGATCVSLSVCVCVCPSVRVRVHIKSEIIRKIFGCSTWATKQIYNPNEQQ